MAVGMPYPLAVLLLSAKRGNANLFSNLYTPILNLVYLTHSSVASAIFASTPESDAL